MKIWVENQQEKKKQPEQSHGNRQSQEKNNRNNLLPDRTQPNAASYDSCQSGQDRQPGQNVEWSHPATSSQGKKEIERDRRNNSIDSPEEPEPKLHRT